ncbi:MAG: glycosyltransferase family 39 protein, partial [Planctomycetes bacterium]|nr:glycosyltransferase family 39 protein [Planctomycetota bacterium]
MIQTNEDNAARNRWSIALFMIALFGAALRFYGLGFRDFWFDESCTFIYVKYLFDWPEGSSLLAESTNLPYYLLLRGWVECWGESEISYRALSALAATLTIPMVALLARRLADPFTALVAAVLVAVHPLHIHYAHEARAYALWLLLLTIVLWSLHVAATTGRKRWWCLFGLTMLSALHLHYFSIYLLPATVGVVFVAADRKSAFRAWWITASLVGLAFVPYFVVAVLPASRGGGGTWIAQYFEPHTAFLHTLWAFLPAGAYPEHLRGLSLASVDTVRFQGEFLIAANAAARAVPAVVVTAMIVLLVTRVMRRRLSVATGNRAWTTHAFLAFASLGPLLLAWIYSMAIAPNYLVARYDLVAWPAFMVWLGVVMTSFARAVAP